MQKCYKIKIEGGCGGSFCAKIVAFCLKNIFHFFVVSSLLKIVEIRENIQRFCKSFNSFFFITIDCFVFKTAVNSFYSISQRFFNNFITFQFWQVITTEFEKIVLLVALAVEFFSGKNLEQSILFVICFSCFILLYEFFF